MTQEEKFRSLKPQIEAALFMSSDIISTYKLSRMFKVSPNIIQNLIDKIKLEYEDPIHGIHVFETSEGYQMKVKPEYVGSVRGLTPYKDLNKGLLRVLALVAYKQPITQSQIVKIIGNRAYDYVKKLQQKGLIKIEKYGRTKALIATKEFANYFGLEKTEDLKKFFSEMTENAEKKD